MGKSVTNGAEQIIIGTLESLKLPKLELSYPDSDLVSKPDRACPKLPPLGRKTPKYKYTSLCPSSIYWQKGTERKGRKAYKNDFLGLGEEKRPRERRMGGEPEGMIYEGGKCQEENGTCG
jgi:hypothetical protein